MILMGMGDVSAHQFARVRLSVQVDADNRLTQQGREVEDRAGLRRARLALHQARLAQDHVGVQVGHGADGGLERLQHGLQRDKVDAGVVAQFHCGGRA